MTDVPLSTPPDSTSAQVCGIDSTHMKRAVLYARVASTRSRRSMISGTLFEDGDLGQAFWPWQLAPRPTARSVRPLNIINLSTGPQMALGGRQSGHGRPQKIRKPSKEPACACARLSTVVHFSPLPTGARGEPRTILLSVGGSAAHLTNVNKR
jgi:hypothetical protein